MGSGADTFQYDLQNAGFAGEFFSRDDAETNARLLIYSTDASVYREKPVAVAIPSNDNDIKLLIGFAARHQLTLIPRAAGTSLAGQVVGQGIVVDISRHFDRILEVNPQERWVRVQPGVIRDDLNHHLLPFGLMYGPETSTSSRAMIGGMIGNNSCGLHSIIWGSARDHLLEVKGLLSDGSEVVFAKDDPTIADAGGLKGEIYRALYSLLDDEKNKTLIRETFPKKEVVRRNTGYALDSLISMQPFPDTTAPFDLCKLIAGSEGTLMFITEAKLNLLALPPANKAVVCIHCRSMQEAMIANRIALTCAPAASELVDKFIMDFTIGHPVYKQYRDFIQGDPAALLMVEFMADTLEQAQSAALFCVQQLQQQACGYAWPVLYNEETRKAWEIRKAGLGLLRNLPGDAQPVNLIEDCAVAPQDLPDYVADIEQLLAKYTVKAGFYAHAGAGELHIEPILNLKTREGVTLFRTLLRETVDIVKKYNGSLSGEHGDGRLRGEAIAWAVGEDTYQLFRKVKKIFDPHNVFNKGKIVDAGPMDEGLRIMPGTITKEPVTYFNFSADTGILRMAEKCSGSGDCRRSHLSGGTMCPSFMATRNEKDTTRARANILREFLTHSSAENPFDHKEIKEVMDLCLSCKGCKSECPSMVDITKMKAEFLQHYYDANGIPARAKMIGYFSRQMQLAIRFRFFYNLVFGQPALRRMANRVTGFHPDRTIPLLPGFTLRKWAKQRKQPVTGTKGTVYLFCDEFTNYYDAEIGKKAILLLEALGYTVNIPVHIESGRTFLSKGMVKKAKEIANRNIQLLSAGTDSSSPIIGVEPSGILTLRDEYRDLAEESNREKAIALAGRAFTFEEFIAGEYLNGNISKESFTKEKKHIMLHAHCYQKVLSSQQHGRVMLSLPENYSVEIIPSGCCGMAGAFGYEKEHYDVSMAVGELVLFPAVRQSAGDVIIAASGTSCRHQIKDGTRRKAKHPAEILWEALLK